MIITSSNRLYGGLWGFILIMGLAGCEGDPTDTSTDVVYESTGEVDMRFDKFLVEENIAVPKDGVPFLGMVFGISSTQDYLLVRDLTQAPFVTVYDKASLDSLGKIIPNGKGPGESLNPGKLLPVAGTNTFWLFDGMMQRFQLFDVASALAMSQSGDSYEPLRDFTLMDSLRGSNDPDIVSDSLFVTPSLTFDDCRFFYFDPAPHLLRKVGKLPPPQSNWPKQGEKAHFSIAASYYIAKLATHPQKDWVAVAYVNTDVLEIYKEGTLVRRIQGPEDIEVQKEIREEQRGLYLAQNSQETQTTYLQVHSTDQYIFGQYRGENADQSRTIFVFDWEGRPIKKLLLDQDFSVCWIEESKEKTCVLYVALSETGVIVRIPLDIGLHT